MIALPAKLGGLGIYDPTKTSDREYKCSREITKQLVGLITHQDPSVDKINTYELVKTKRDLKTEFR